MTSIMHVPEDNGEGVTGWVPVWVRAWLQAGVFPAAVAALLYIVFAVFSGQLSAHDASTKTQAAEQTRLLHAICTGVGSQIVDPVRRDAAMARCDEVK